MKKTLLCALMAAAVGTASAQAIYTENFDGVTAPALPAGYLEQNVDGSTPPAAFAGLNCGDHGWVTAKLNSGGNAAFSYSYTVAQADDWMILPAVALTGNYALTWTAASGNSAPNADTYEIRVSTTNDQLASFTDLIYANTEGAGAFVSHYIDLSQYNGQTVYIAFRNVSQNGYYLLIDALKIDKAVTSFDAGITAIGNGDKYATPGTNNALKVTLSNPKNTTINSVDVYYSINDGAAQMESLTGLALYPGGSKSVDLSATLNRASVGTYKVKAWIANANGTGGTGVATNDTVTDYFYAVTDFPQKNVVIEEGTGTWCGWCPRGAVYMDSIHAVHGDRTVLIAVHNGDPMTVAAYDGQMGLTGYPGARVNRSVVVDPSQIFDEYDRTINDYGLATLNLEAYYNAATKKVTGHATALFAGPANGDFRLAMVITEDSVTGSGSTYAQTNYYSGGANGEMGGYENLPQSVPANQMHYDFVAREIVGGFKGQTGSLPAVIATGASANYNFTSSALATAVRKDKIKAHLLLIDAKSNKIYNGKTFPITMSTTGVEEIGVVVENIVTYPNPVVNTVNVDFELGSAQDVSVSVVNSAGQVVIEQAATKLAAGKQTMSINTTELSAGAYFLQIGTSTGVVSQGFVK